MSTWDGWNVYKEQVTQECINIKVEEGVEIKLWIIKPKSMEGDKNAAFIFAHGGAGLMLSAEENLPECYRYAVDWDCIVFSVDYRKGPETKCPNQ